MAISAGALVVDGQRISYTGALPEIVVPYVFDMSEEVDSELREVTLITRRALERILADAGYDTGRVI